MYLKTAILVILTILNAGCVFRGRRGSIALLANSTNIKKPPVIIIPGILGSLLADRDSGRIVWLRATQAFGLEPAPNLGFRVDEQVSDPRAVEDRYEPVGIIDKITIFPMFYDSPIYSPLLDSFTEIGYKIGDCDFPRADEDAFVFHYDFRRDAAETAGKLARAIERVRDTRADPNEKVVIVAHSFGGLITRYYLMYGGADVLSTENPKPTSAGAENVASVVFLNSPHHGSLALFQFLLKGYGALFPGQLLSSEEIRTMPSAYQLLPCPSNDCYLEYDRLSGEISEYREPGDRILNIYDPKTWTRFEWLPEAWRDGPRNAFFIRALERGRLWWNALEQHWTPPAHLRALAVGGTSELTPGRAILTKGNNDIYQFSFTIPGSDPDRSQKELKYRVLTPGDSRVTMESALDLPFAYRLASTATHDLVYHDRGVLDNVILFLFGDYFLPFTYDTNTTGGGDQK